MRRFLVLLVLIAILLPINADEPDYFSIAESITADELQQLIDDGFDVNAALPNEYLPLELVALCSPYNVITTLLDNGADINATGFNGNGILIALIFREAPISLEEAKELLEKISDVDMVNSQGFTPLFYAVDINNLDAVSLLIEFGADVNKTASGYTPVWFAYTPECVRMLTEAGADPDATVEYEDGEYSLLCRYVSEYSIEYEMAKALIEAGADVNFMDPNGMTPFSYALKEDAEKEFIDFMIEHGASAEYLNEELLTKLVGDVFTNPIDSDTLDYLASLKFPIDVRDNSGYSLLMSFLEYDEYPDADIVSRLLKMGANPNARDLDGNTPLMIAAADCRDTEIIELLIDAGANVNARNEDFMTPLMASVINKNPEVVELVIEAGADINAQDEDGETALFYAAADAVNPAVIDVLLEAGADATIVNERGRKAFESAGEYSDVYRTPAFWRLVDASF